MTIYSFLYLILLLISSFCVYFNTQVQTNPTLALASALGVGLFFALFVLSFASKATVSKTDEPKGQIRYHTGREDLNEK